MEDDEGTRDAAERLGGRLRELSNLTQTAGSIHRYMIRGLIKNMVANNGIGTRVSCARVTLIMAKSSNRKPESNETGCSISEHVEKAQQLRNEYDNTLIARGSEGERAKYKEKIHTGAL